VTGAATADWAALRGGLLVVAALGVASVVGWLVHAAVHDPPSPYAQTVRCLTLEKGLVLEEPRDPLARSAGRGATRTAVEGNRVTIAVGSSVADAERIVAGYRAIAGARLGHRLERREHNVYLWDNDPSPSQRQALYDCAY
jgi:hypothetical protein